MPRPVKLRICANFPSMSCTRSDRNVIGTIPCVAIASLVNRTCSTWSVKAFFLSVPLHYAMHSALLSSRFSFTTAHGKTTRTLENRSSKCAFCIKDALADLHRDLLEGLHRWRARLQSNSSISFLEVWLSNSLHASTCISRLHHSGLRPHILYISYLLGEVWWHHMVVTLRLFQMSFASFARESFQEIVTFRPLAQLPGWLHVLNSRRWKQTTNAKNTGAVFLFQRWGWQSWQVPSRREREPLSPTNVPTKHYSCKPRSATSDFLRGLLPFEVTVDGVQGQRRGLLAHADSESGKQLANI